MTSSNSLELVKIRAVVDIDQLSPEIAQALGPFCDMTSNQALIAGVVTSDSGGSLVGQVVEMVKEQGKSGEEAVDLALDLFAVLLAKAVVPHIGGNVHAQLSPRYAHSVEKSLEHAHRLIELFAVHGIPASRVCLKIPSTGAGLAACAILQKEGIQTLATTLFSVDQAVAAVQAKCLYIAPYFNELSVHFEPETWVDYGGVEETAEKHPMCAVIKDVVEMYRLLEKRPLVMPASIVTATEALAISTLGVDHITISGKVLQALADDKDVADFRGDKLDVDLKDESAGAQASDRSSGRDMHAMDFLADHGRALDESNRADASVQRRLDYALRAFTECEQKIIDVVRPMLAAA